LIHRNKQIDKANRINMTDEVAAAPAKKERETWSSRTAFYFAGVGAAVGFGNVWRFPALSVTYGGGAFFIPYLMALFLIGIPITILEIGFGTSCL
jgi:NSS family neurotransmitter:Na+ symporter